jgi:hypothetical protein
MACAGAQLRSHAGGENGSRVKRLALARNATTEQIGYGIGGWPGMPVTTNARRQAVKIIAKLTKGIIMIALTTLIGSAPASAGTFVYVSHADDGDIGVFSVQPDGSLKPGERAKVENLAMPMAVSPDRRFLYAVARSKPYSVFVHAIDPNTGALKTLSVSPLAESFPYISLDKTGRYLFGASYGSHLISVNAVAEDGRVAPEPLQVIPVGRNAHSIRTDESNRFVFVATLERPDIPVHVRSEDRPSCFEHTGCAPDETRARPPPLRHVERQQIRVRPERADRHGYDVFAEQWYRAVDGNKLGIRLAA